MQRVQPGRERRWVEAQNIVIGHVAGDRDQTGLQVLGIVEVKELASGELCDGCSGVSARKLASSKVL